MKCFIALCALILPLSLFSVHLSIDPLEGLIDEPINIKITDLQPSKVIEVTVNCKDAFGYNWASKASFLADNKGTIDLSKDAPLNGTYQGVDSMGLIWSMNSDEKEAGIFYPKGDVWQLHFLVSADDKELAKETLQRRKVRKDVTKEEVREEGIVGTLFSPSSPKEAPLIITMTGSNGGLSTTRAKLLASHGYETFALAYFGVEGLSSNLEEIPLEYFKKTFLYLSQKGKGKKFVLLAPSRGGELALLLASLFSDDIAGVVAYLPSSVVWGSIPTGKVSPWVYQGVSVPFIGGSSEEIKNRQEDNQPLSTEHFLLEIMKNNPIEKDKAAIQVENISCPLLLISGDNDKMWPSKLFCDEIMERLEKHGSLIERQHLCYQDAGHGIYLPFMPTTSSLYWHPIAKAWFTLGGTTKGNAKADKDSWKAVLTFLDTLKGG